MLRPTMSTRIESCKPSGLELLLCTCRSMDKSAALSPPNIRFKVAPISRTHTFPLYSEQKSALQQPVGKWEDNLLDVWRKLVHQTQNNSWLKAWQAKSCKQLESLNLKSVSKGRISAHPWVFIAYNGHMNFATHMVYSGPNNKILGSHYYVILSYMWCNGVQWSLFPSFPLSISPIYHPYTPPPHHSMIASLLIIQDHLL